MPRRCILTERQRSAHPHPNTVSGPSMCTVCLYGLRRLGGFLWGKIGIRSAVKRGAVKWKNTGAATIIF